MNVEELFKRQAEWQALQKDKTWEEKLEQSLLLRNTALLLQASNPNFRTPSNPLPPTQNKTTNYS